MLKFVSLLLVLFSLNITATESFDCKDFNYNPRNIYPICEDGDELLSDVEEKSLEENKQSLLIFGYSACPWCQNLHKIFKTDKKEDFKESCPEVENLNIQELPIGFYFKDSLGKYEFKSIKGRTILENIANEKGVEVDGYPMIVVSNPKNGKKQLVDTGELEDNTNGKGHSFVLLCNALKKAMEDNK